MSKKKNTEKEEVGLFICGILFASVLAYIIIGSYFVPKSSLTISLNFLAQLGCPEMPYHQKINKDYIFSGTLNQWDSYYREHPELWKKRIIWECFKDNCIFSEEEIIFYNFTTGRYLPDEKMVECSEYDYWIFKQSGSICCPSKEFKSQIFTLQEFYERLGLV